MNHHRQTKRHFTPGFKLEPVEQVVKRQRRVIDVAYLQRTLLRLAKRLQRIIR